jgi:hypothetical protein
VTIVRKIGPKASILTSLSDTDILVVSDELAKDNRAMEARKAVVR